MNMVRCLSCDLEYIDPYPAKEALDNLYNEDYYNNGYLKLRDRRILQAEYYLNILKNLNNTDSEKLKILDIGTGLGYFLILAGKSNYKVWGIETSEFARKYSNENFGLNILSSLNELPDTKFDFITFWDVLGHIDNPDTYLNYCKEHIAKTGYLIIKFPNFNSCWHRINFLMAKYRHVNTVHAPTIIWRFSVSTIKKFLNNFGFRIVKIDTIQQTAPPQKQNWKLNLIHLFARIIDYLTNNRQEIIIYAKYCDKQGE
jgi:2-polyprenyl-3-methyl-5-hydroxy-6-metoxy-1,4-benzoquinol methylase